MSTLLDLLTPRHVAIVGASDDPTRIGGRPLAYLRTHAQSIEVYPINPNRETVQGLRAYPTLAAVPGPIDFVVVAVPAAAVSSVVHEAVAKHAKAALVFSSGFAETGVEGAARQARLAEFARSAGLRLFGPNCLGLFNTASGFFPTFSSAIEYATPTMGRYAIASQSGAYGSHLYFVAHRRGLGLRYWVTSGNEADVSVAELIGCYADDENVDVILAYIESVQPRDGQRLIESLRRAHAARKPVVIMKVGRSEVGALAASSHTASLAGEDAVYDAVFRDYGALRVETTEQMLDVAVACRTKLYPVGRRLGVVTISGGAGVLMADAAQRHALDVAPMPDAAQAALREILPFAAPRNPVDVTAQMFNDLTLVPQFLRTVLAHGRYDGLIGFWTSIAGAPSFAEPLLASLREALGEHEHCPFLQVLVAPESVRAHYEQARLPCFEDPSRAVYAMAALMTLGERFAKPIAIAAAPTEAPPLEPQMNESAAKAWFASLGMPMVTDTVCRSLEETRAAVGALRGPAVLKIVSGAIAHKSDIGAVELGVTVETAASAYRSILDAVQRARPDAPIDGVSVSAQIDGGIECLLGARDDPVFGPVVLVGIGGLFTELIDDTVVRCAPVSETSAREMLDALRVGALLKGVRGRAGVDIAALCRAISRFSTIAAACAGRFESMEINPLLARADGCWGLDALIVTRSTQTQ